MFENVIFAGGGSRCVWQLGFWQGAKAAGLALDECVSYVASTSAGCAMATAAILKREQEALDRFKALTAANPSNIHWQNLKPGSGKPLLLHMIMYRRAMTELLSTKDLLRLQQKTIRMDKFDYANPDGLQKVFELGAADGRAFAQRRLKPACESPSLVCETP